MTQLHRPLLRARAQSPDSASECVSENPGTPNHPQGSPGETPCLDSESLLQGHGSVTISHRGAIYRLQTTRQGKLILTK